MTDSTRTRRPGPIALHHEGGRSTFIVPARRGYTSTHYSQSGNILCQDIITLERRDEIIDTAIRGGRDGFHALAPTKAPLRDLWVAPGYVAVKCDGEAHSPEAAGHIDHCGLCAPLWGTRVMTQGAADAIARAEASR